MRGGGEVEPHGFEPQYLALLQAMRQPAQVHAHYQPLLAARYATQGTEPGKLLDHRLRVTLCHCRTRPDAVAGLEQRLGALQRALRLVDGGDELLKSLEIRHAVTLLRCEAG